MIEIKEKLYRAVKRSKPDTLNAKNKATSALFKGEKGISVDRDMGRAETEVIDALKKHFKERCKAIVTFPARECKENGILIVPTPSQGNVFHAELYDGEERNELTSVQCLILADISTTVYYNNEIQWTNAS